MKNEYSSLKIFHHKDALDAIECGRHQAPFYIRIKPTNLCNHHCAYCTYGSGENENKTENRDTVVRTDMIPWGKMQEIIQDMSDMGVKAVTFSGGGEPLTYPHILDTVKFIKKHHIELSLISNGQLLSGQIANLFYDAKWVRISFDSPNEDDYTKFRKVSKQAFQQVCGNIRDFAQNKNNDCVLYKLN
ncbi:radical SAM protein [Pectinatus frisingensis]|uniref:radical SAM protein n=1 Tax=Pectinatus frisingensis TaxID=865 RepID=UPI0018C638C1|nr:radical SAM protein [Pectinatus frisingensis]